MATITTPDAPVTSQLRVWVDGQLLDDLNQPVVSAVDHGMVVGNGVFEALKVTEAGPFSVQRHLDRLTRSAQALGLPDPDHAAVRAGIESVLESQGIGTGKLRITYTGGQGPLGSQAAFGPPTLIVAIDTWAPYAQGTTIITTPWTRNTSGAMTGVKTTSYAENVRGLAYANERGGSEGIFVNTEGQLCEGTGSNIFCIFGEQIITPPLSAGPLAGITRGLLLEWCDITEANITLAKAQTADEVFITSSLRDVQAVRRWDSVDFGEMGAVTRRAAETFAERAGAQLEP